MQLKQLNHYIFLIMAGCAMVLSIIFSTWVYFLSQSEALEESQALTKNLMATASEFAVAALNGSNQTVGQGVINSLLLNDVVHSVTLEGYPDEFVDGMLLQATNPASKEGLTAIELPIMSLIDDTQVLGKLQVEPSADWVKRNAAENAGGMIFGLIIVIFSACLMAAQLIKFLISKPLVKVVEQLQQIKPGDDDRLSLPKQLQDNEIGALVNGFNDMLDRVNKAILVERHLRKNMEIVQEKLEQAKVEAEHATEAKSNFLATMSHEIRTPMNSILGFLELAIEDPELGKETKRHLQVAHSSARFLLQLISDILDVSKIESGKLELEAHPFDLAQLLSEIRDLMEIKAREKHLELALVTPAQLAPAYLGDQYRLRQILLNLIGNAIKFTETGGVTIEVSKRKQNQFNFSILDTGIGIAEDKIAKILEPFTQVDASITRQFGGTGLGTTISSELIHLMGSDLQIESEEGKGSRFHFTIELPESKLASKTNTRHVSHLEARRKLKLLVVDDVIDNITLARIRLENAGHYVTDAHNGLQAVAAAKSEAFDMILMDLQMPEMDGYAATAKIRELDSHNAQVPIIAMTAHAMLEELERVKQNGFDDVVTKPIDFHQLFSVIEQHYDVPPNTTEPSTARNKNALIDFPGALSTWQNEPELYKALHNFAKDNQAANKELQSYLKQQLWQQALELLHKIKGSAANIGLNQLASASAELEAIVATRDNGRITSLLTQFNSTLAASLAAIGRLPGQPKADPPVAASVSNPAASLAQIEQFIEACQHYDPDEAEAAFDALKPHLGTSTSADLNKALEGFNFEQAGQIAARLAQEIKDKQA